MFRRTLRRFSDRLATELGPRNRQRCTRSESIGSCWESKSKSKGSGAELSSDSELSTSAPDERKAPNEVSAIVLDLGSHSCKAGYAGEDAPKAVLPSASDEETNINLLLKVARGAKEEDVKADLHRTPKGKWTVKQAGLL
ncbi:hypothetical protein R1flu_010247 [Riccia fluitans]|uniref:Uncharacterized protein n=1 Tax=Riccia fluitans TaxID=41844 RepID=A0ABD1Z4G9_9MARC